MYRRLLYSLLSLWDSLWYNSSKITQEDHTIKRSFSQHALDVMAQRGILEAWVFDTLETFSKKVSISDIEEHYFKQIEDDDFRCLKVVYNPKFERVITVYFDRGMRKRGCR